MFLNGQVQVAGIRDLEEARMLLACGVDMIGFPLRLPVHAEDITEAGARDVIRALDSTACVLITYEEDPDELVRLCRYLCVSTVQLHADVAPDVLARIKNSSDLNIIKSYVVGRDHTTPEDFARDYTPVCDAFITDTFDPATGACGATGRVHDWALSRRLVEASLRPVILAGGLNPSNVREAVLAVRPAAVDAHTGVEGPDGAKDAALVRAFVDQARAGFLAAGL